MRSRAQPGPAYEKDAPAPFWRDIAFQVSRPVRLVSRPSGRASVPNLTGPPQASHPGCPVHSSPRDYFTSGRAAWTYHEGVPAV